MCGLMGALAPDLQPIDFDILKDLLIVSMLRGYQGAGCTFVTKKGDPQILRTLGSGSQLALGGKFDEYSRKRKYSLVFGHTRWPTRGWINDIGHIHPFHCDHIIGVHNGTMEHIMGVKPEKGDSDSEMLYKAIAEHGIKRAIEESKGAYSLVWIDMLQKTLNFLRNYERPLVFGRLPNDDVLYWASEAKFLEVVLSRRIEGEVKIETAITPMDMRLVFDISNKSIPKEIGREEIRPPFIPSKTVHGNSHWSGHHTYAEDIEDNLEDIITSTASSTGKSVVPFSRTLKPRREFRGHFRVGRNYWINREAMQRLLASGCDYCTQASELDDFLEGGVQFINNDVYLCHKCSKLDPAVKNVKEYYKLPETWPSNAL